MAYHPPGDILVDDGYFTDRQRVMENIQAAVSCLAPHGIDVAAFTPEAVNQCGLETDRFLKLCKIFKSCSDGKILSAILDQAVSANILPGPSTMNVRQCIDLIKWMKSKNGQNIVHGVHKRAKLEKKTPQGDSVVDTALIRVLQLQIQDYNNNNDKFFFGSPGFVEPTNVELDDKCYSMYCADAADKNAIARPRHDPMYMVVARKKYEGKARDEFMREFVRQEGSKEKLVGYLRAKIEYLEENYYYKQARNCRHYLNVIAGGEEGNNQTEINPATGSRDVGRLVGKKRRASE